MVSVRALTLLLVLAMIASVAGVVSAQTESDDPSKMYLAEATTRTIYRANVDGSQIEDVTRHTGPGVTGFTDLDLDLAANKMYWVIADHANDGSGRVVRANLDGSQHEVLVTGSRDVTRPLSLALAVAAGKMYGTDGGGTVSIRRANLDGSQVENLIQSGLDDPRGLNLDVAAGKLYWVDLGARKIQRSSLDGSRVEDLVTTGLDSPISMALDVGASKMYWVDLGADKIQRANLDGSQVEDLVATGLEAPAGIALDVIEGKMYWTDVNTNKVQRANLDGSQVEDLITSRTGSAIALDVASTPSPGPGSDECGETETLTVDGTVSGTWAAGCDSRVSGRGHARYYSFTLAEDSEVTITLESTDVNTYLYLREGDATSGTALQENNDVDSGDTDSRIVATLPAGTYTIEATTYTVGVTGSFTLSVSTNADLASVSVSRAVGSEDARLRLGSAVSLTAIFSRPVFEFTAEDIMAANGDAGNFAGSEGGTMYTFDVTPSDIGEVTVDIAAGAALDADGAGNAAAPQFSLGITYDDDHDGGISRVEVIEAIRDYFSGELTRAQVIVTIQLYFDTPTEPDRPATDRDALVAFYNATDGPNWANNSGWLSNAPLGEWHGVTTNGSGRVVRLDLRENSLSGQIPGELGALGSLRDLYLANTDGICTNGCEPSSPTANRLPGPIPSELSELTKLRDLRLAFLQLSGPVPTWLEDLSNLHTLGLSANKLSGNIPEQLGNLSNLTSLQLGHNTLTGTMPRSIGNLSGLQHLTLHDNQLTGSIPSSYGNLSALKTMFLFSGNQLTGCIPAGLQGVPRNDFFAQLPFCDANSLASDRAALVALYNATGGGNWADNTGWLSNAPMGQWYGVTTDDNGRVIELVLADNGLAGNIPADLGALTKLEVLNLGGRLGSCNGRPWVCTSSSPTPNRLTGAIPVALERLVNLEQFVLSYNQLSGTIPARLGNLSKLEVLDLHSSHLTGTVPRELANLANLRVLNLGFNNLNENMTLPTWLAGRSNLQEIRLGGLNLTGTVPEWLGDLTNLRVLSLINNRLTGEISSQLSQLDRLVILNLGHNGLTGSIPPELGSIRNLNHLTLSRNQLTGSIPSELANLRLLRTLLLSNNRLTGCVPSGLRDVSRNDFTQLGLPFCGQ